MEKILLTGCCGFIGWKVGEKLLEESYEVLGIDEMNNYYDIRLKEWRLEQLKKKNKNFKFLKMDIASKEIERVIKNFSPGVIINLAARAGVRASIEDPFIYFRSNLTGTLKLLEYAQKLDIEKFILASTSSIYAGESMPFSENLAVNKPISPYAASKKAAEVTCYTYHYLYNIKVNIFRFFTVYGPAGRPDMSVFKFIKLIEEETPIIVFGDGKQNRDFTYVEDIANGVVKGLNPENYQIINLGSNQPHELNEVISLIEKELGKKAVIEYREFCKTDVKGTWANIKKAGEMLGWQPHTYLEEGIEKTVKWYMENKNWLKNIKLKD
jgi:UDP-glucuronate 4-epimerase